MTLLHQAAQKAVAVPLVEQLRSIPSDAKLRIDTPNALGCMDTCSIPVGRLCHEAASALQQQPEPVAPNEWAAEAATVMAQFIHLSAQPERDAWAQNASRAIRLLNAPALQEVPREPVSDAAIFAIAGSLGWCRLIDEEYRRSMELPAGSRWSNTMTADDVLLFARALLAASPSTTQQQEAGSTAAVHLTADEISSLMMDLSDHDGSDFEPECPSCTAFRKLASACVAAAPSTPESAEKDDAGGGKGPDHA